MLHPILETLFFLKVARESVCGSIRSSRVENKTALINYIQNEASDYEVMHLVTLGEMPKEKFNYAAEQKVWELFKQTIIMNTESLKKEIRTSDIMNIVYEMGPVSQLGYSSAAPILEFDRANGRLNLSYLKEGRDSKPWETPEKELRRASGGKEVGRIDPNTQAQNDKNLGVNATPSKIQQFKNKLDYGTQTAASVIKGASKSQVAGAAAAGAVGVAGLYGLYKLYKGWKAKKAAAKTPEAKAAAAKGMAATQAKINAKKAKK